MNKIRFPKAFYVGVLIMLTACQVAEQPSKVIMLKPGDSINGMSLTTGTADVPPLWAFCSPAQHNGNTTISDCNTPVLPRLGIGHIYMLADDNLNKLNWSDLTWQLSIDDRPVDLETFGTFEFVVPSISKSPSPVREVFKTLKVWDVVLTNLSPGQHTIHGVAQMGTDSYKWIINLNIQGNALSTGTPWAGTETQKIS